MSDSHAGPDGLLVIDKPGGMTSHDVVARVRRLAGTRKVGHAGTLDPMATGVLVVGLGRATRLLGHLALSDKTYEATVRLGESTVTDDAEGELVASVPAGELSADRIAGAARGFVGTIEQVPSAVSAIKVEGRRSYARVRAGEQVELKARTVTVSDLTVHDLRRTGDRVDVDFAVTCSSGTYVRAIARDLGAALGVGGHLTMLRRTRVGGFTLAAAMPPAELLADYPARGRGVPDHPDLPVVPLTEAVAAAFPRVDVDADVALAIGHTGRTDAPASLLASPVEGPIGVFGPDGVVALMEQRGERLRSLVVLAPATGGPAPPGRIDA